MTDHFHAGNGATADDLSRAPAETLSRIAETALAAGKDVSIDDLLGQLARSETQRAADNQAEFEEMVRVVTDGGQPPEAERIGEVLRDLGKTTDDFRAAVELRRNRLQWRADLDRHAIIVAEATELHAQVGAERARFRDLEKAHAESLRPLIQQIQRLVAQSPDAESAKRQLQKTAPQWIFDRLAELAAGEQKANLEIMACREHAKRLRECLRVNQANRAAATRRPLASSLSPEAAEAARASAAADDADDRRLDAAAAQEDGRADALRSRLDAIDAERGKLLAAALVP